MNFKSYKVRLKLRKKPKTYDYRKFKGKLAKVIPLLIEAKLHYKKQFQPVIYTYQIPEKFKLKPLLKLKGILADLFDVTITEHTYLDGPNSIQSIRLLGEREQCSMGAHLISIIYYLYWGSLDSKRKTHRTNSKHKRRKERREGKITQSGDYRFKSSAFSDKILRFFREVLEEALENIRNENQKAFNRGLRRTKRIKRYIWDKYKRKLP